MYITLISTTPAGGGIVVISRGGCGCRVQWRWRRYRVVIDVTTTVDCGGGSRSRIRSLLLTLIVDFLTLQRYGLGGRVGKGKRVLSRMVRDVGSGLVVMMIVSVIGSID